MKSHGNLFRNIASFSNLLLAAQKAQRGKRFKEGTARFNLNLEGELLRLQDELLRGAYRHGGYRDFFISDPKRRLISAAPYRDRVVHHALCNVIEPIFDRTFIFDSYACRTGKGTHAAIDRYSRFARKNRYVLKCDIQKYFSSIDHGILLGALMKKIRCRKTIALLQEIVGSRRDGSCTMYFPGDDLFTPHQRPKGIPIGNLTSQFFANVYLNGFDHFVKETLGCRYFIRYVDDFVVFDNEKERLQHVKKEMGTNLEKLRLKMHRNKSRVYRTADGIPFLGFRIFPTHRVLRKESALRMRRRMRAMAGQYRDGHIELEEVGQRIQSWIGHAAHGNTFRLRQRVLGAVAFQRDGAGNASRGLLEQQSG